MLTLLALGRGGGGGGGGGVEADGGTREVCVIEVERSERCVSVSGACCRVYAVSGACWCCQALLGLFGMQKRSERCEVRVIQ